ncbi:ABC transporter ATP-binding protein/permease [Absiella sp. AM22-9]|uniref:ABC transporter ATP-binding protein/permease n=1 Tax=Absiella sp. AM22-9 TaxID=2291996 RepID=UPI000E3FF761|nr:ABC transporter ATP-binding protein/permease [Absiella sp. AM22-9]RGB53321.1 ATP-binding cassette domain-containing protein [Absiella sp. AM22-9]
MLKLDKIRKTYKTGNFEQTALDDVSICFRNNEFAAILGPSGSGKTTMLNIIGGLDHYDSGDLMIDGISTKKYTSKDWDTYRNNRIGFVFQSYNLIPHQSILANVELALTLSGIPATQRKERAMKALEEVGLLEHIHKKPNQLSGGQMQRVAIARALVNNPEIVLADEPTGALDTKTSVQVMELLMNIAKDRLVIMVTHNPELAHQYANRIVQLKDGSIISDSHPIKEEAAPAPVKRNIRKAKMSLRTAVALSFSNLMTKKARTFVTALAGSIGIIGIAAILSLANGINQYIENVERETLSLYPLSIQRSGIDISKMLSEPTGKPQTSTNKEDDKNVSEISMIKNMFSYQSQNDTAALKTYLEKHKTEIDPYVNTIQYMYHITPQIYLTDTSKSIEQVNPDTLFQTGNDTSQGMSSLMGGFGTMSAFHELPQESKMYENQYDVMEGRWAKNYDEMVLVLSSNGKVSDYVLYSMGINDREKLRKLMEDTENGKPAVMDEKDNDVKYAYDTLMAPKFRVIDPADRYVYDETHQIWKDQSKDQSYMKKLIKNGIELKIVGIVKPKSDSAITSLSSGLNYSSQLTKHLMDAAMDKPIVKQQLQQPNINVFTGKSFQDENNDQRNKLKFSDLISIDENKLKNAFGMDTSQINLNTTIPFDQFSLDIPLDALPKPDMHVQDIMTSIANQVHVPVEQLSPIMMSLYQDFMSEEIKQGVSDPTQIVLDLQTYLSKPEIQEKLMKQIQGVVDPTQISSQISEAINTQLTSVMQTYVKEVSTILQDQIKTQSQQLMSQMMAQLPDQLRNSIHIDTSAFQEAFSLNMSEEELTNLMNSLMNPVTSTYERNMNLLGYADVHTPSQINIYPLNFQSKQNILDFLDQYNAGLEKKGKEMIHYNDLVGTMMTSVTDIVNTISAALIAFVAISLVVSSIMIGVITYISVIERKKEIGILRALGASKHNIRSVFNAETLIVGFVAGMLGVLVTALLCIPANIFVEAKFEIENIAQLPIDGAVILVIISMLLTYIAGLFPASAAARKDPVEALRSE